MVMVVENSAAEIARVTGNNVEPPKEEPKEEAKAEAKPEPKEEREDDEAPDFAKQLGLTAEQHKTITDIIKREVGKKHRQAKEAEEFAAAQYNERRLAEERAEKAQRDLEEARKALQPAKDEPKRPDRTKFDSPDAYEDALLAWNRAESIKEYAEEQRKEREKARQEQIVAEATARINAAREIVPDFDEVVAAADDIIPSHIAAYMQESDMFAELGYHFAKHPEDLKRVADMPSRTYSDLLRVGVALDKIQSNIQPFAKAAKASNGSQPSPTNGASAEVDTGTVPSQPRAAAPVIQPITVGSATQVDKPANRRTYEEERAYFEKTHRRDLTRRSRH